MKVNQSHNTDDFNHTDIILRVENIYKAFNNQTVLDGISFSLKNKEILGIIGPSGGGKTTLLKCIDLLEIVDKGEIEYFGSINLKVDSNRKKTVRDLNSKIDYPFNENSFNILRRNMGFVFQGFNLWEERTVIDNLILAPRVVLKKSKQEAKSEALQLSIQFGLKDKLKSKGWELSGGQKQRVAIMRALMMGPKLVLLDEITSALDPVLTVEVMQAIRQLRDRGLAMIVVTHHIEFATSLCDRLLFLSMGQIIQLDTPEKLRNFPATDEVKSFLKTLQSAR